MFGQILAGLGSAVGGAFGGGILSTIGRFAGKTLGNYLEHLNYEAEEYYHFKNIKESFALSKAIYGQPITLIFGTSRVNGKIIWANPLREVQKTTVSNQYLANSDITKSVHNLIECEYYLSFAVSICEGEVAEINRIWAGDELLDLGQYNSRLYLGHEHQLPDPLIAQTCEQGKSPAFRDLSYIVFEDLPLSDFSNIIPNFSFEVTRKANIPSNLHNRPRAKLASGREFEGDAERKTAAYGGVQEDLSLDSLSKLPVEAEFRTRSNISVEELVEGFDIIPGSGEFVYDPIIQYQTTTLVTGEIINKKPINSHNSRNIADSLYSLDQMQVICPNIKWVAPVVCWFGDNLDIAKCTIKPSVESNCSTIKYSEEWQIGKYFRDTARLISRDSEGFPKYGGSVNDASVIRYLQELKRRNYQIMFYPMLFLDIPQKPWRGHLSGNPNSVAEFFNKQGGYNEFILHYANLVKDHVDAFVIGSELIGLTSISRATTSNTFEFPAVLELVTLAKLVKEIMPNVLLTYAADWSEYHHTLGGWYNLDKLFASPYLDFIGIDAYFPVTRTTNSMILAEEISKGWNQGEGYDYWIDEKSEKQPLTAEYAWKNIRYWWENYHKNPDGNLTEWQPKLKKIWFTEFGFPSIDKATNQPNIFFDPSCRDGGIPRYSTGEVDISLQRISIRSFIEYWQSQEYIEQMFLWTWDARPYPAWPHSNIWRDSNLWDKGHWVNNKFGACTLAALILELSYRCNIPLETIDVSTLDETIEGMILSKGLTAIDIINSLRIIYFFDIIASDQDYIYFSKRGTTRPRNISSQMLVKLTTNSYLEQIAIPRTNIISQLEIYFLNHNSNYTAGFCRINNENPSHKPIPVIKLPVVMSYMEAERLGELILKNAATETKILKFTIPATSLDHQAGDFIILHYLHYHYQLRIITIKLLRFQVEIEGIIDEVETYSFPLITNKPPLEGIEAEEIKYIIMDNRLLSKLKSPSIDTESSSNQSADNLVIAIFLQSLTNQSLYLSLNGDSYNKIAALNKHTFIGTVISFENLYLDNVTPASVIEEDSVVQQHEGSSLSQESTEVSVTIDKLSKIIISCKNFDIIGSNDWKLAKWGNEIIKFRNCQKIGHCCYQIDYMIRGIAQTEGFINSHQPQEYVVLLESNVNIVAISPSFKNTPIYFKISSIESCYNSS